MRKLLLISLLASPAFAAAPATQPTPNELIRQFAESRPPHFDPSRREDSSYRATYDAQYKAFLANRLTLAQKFADLYADDPRAPDLLQFAAQAADDEKEKLSLYRRLAVHYPATDAGKEAAGHVRRADAVGKPFELSFTDAITGRAIDTNDLRGKVILLDFWATWCPECVAAMPRLKSLYEKYHAQGLEILGIDLDDSAAAGGLAKLKSFVSANEIPWPQYHQGKGWDSEFSSSYGIDQLPAMFLVSPDGTLVTTHAEKDLDTLVPELLAKKRDPS